MAGRNYYCSPASFAPAAAKTIIEFVSGAARGHRVPRLVIGTTDTTGTVTVRAKVERLTATGTGTSLTPEPVLDGDLAFSGTVKTNDTVEPTKGNRLWEEEFNILPGWILPLDIGFELSAIAGTGKGLGLELLDNPGVTISVGAFLNED